MNKKLTVKMNYYGEVLFANVSVYKKKHKFNITDKDGKKLTDGKDTYNSYMDKFLNCLSYQEDVKECSIIQNDENWEIILDNYLVGLPFENVFCDPLPIRKKSKKINSIYQKNIMGYKE